MRETARAHELPDSEETSKEMVQTGKGNKEAQRLSQLYDALRQVNHAIARAATHDELFEAACRILVEYGGFIESFVGLVDPYSKQLVLVAHGGEHASFFGSPGIYADDRPEGRGPTGVALRSGEPYICNDYFSDPATSPWRSQATKHGFRASATFPIRTKGAIVGALIVYSVAIGCFQSREIQLLEEAAGDISFALDKFVLQYQHVKSEEATRRLATIVNSSNDAIISKSVDGIINTWNPAAERMFGYPATEICGQHISILFPPDRLGEEIELVRQVKAGEQIVDLDTVRIRKDGRLIPVSLTVSPLVSSTGEVVGMSTIARDISARKAVESSLGEAQEQLLQAQKMEAVGLLAGGIAHDFNNALGVILGYCELLERRLASDELGLQFVRQIHDAERRAASLTRNLLAFSRRQLLRPETLNLANVVEAMEEMLRRLIGAGINLTISCNSGANNIRADRGQVEQILMNLVINARDAMPEGGALTISVETVEVGPEKIEKHPNLKAGRWVLLTVADTGCGIDPSVAAHIFEPFYTTKDASKGTGLGLSTTFGIVKQSEGEISLESKVGIGTTFKIYLPSSEAAIKPQPAKQLALKMASGSEAIMVVENDEVLRGVLCISLRGHGYQVFDTGDPITAISFMSRRDPPIDVLVTDVVMPDFSGPELADRLLMNHPDLRIVFISGYTGELMGGSRVGGPGTALLEKPFTAKDLLLAIREVLASNVNPRQAAPR